jgi:hypothetical protein
MIIISGLKGTELLWLGGKTVHHHSTLEHRNNPGRGGEVSLKEKQ